MAKEEMVTIPKKLFDYLYKRDEWLCTLEAAGIDNCNAYEVAQEMIDDDEDE